MRNSKKLTAILTTLSIATTLSASMFVTSTTGAEIGELYTQTYMEYFDETEESGKVFTEDGKFAEDGLFVFGQNASAENVTLVETGQGGKCLQVVSGGKDVQINTKKGLFEHDVTVVDMWINAATVVSPFPQIKVLNNGLKIGADQANGIMTYVGNGAWRAYNVNNPSDYATNTGGNKWVPVRIILDSINKTVEINVNGSQFSKVATLDTAWDNENVQINFQVATDSKIMIDNFVVSDGTYMTDVYMDYDFEHSSTIGETGSNFFYGINKQVNPVVVYDEEQKNSYLDITNSAGYAIYTNSTFALADNKPMVVEFRMKTDATSNLTTLLRRTSSLVPGLFTVANGIVTEGSKTKNVADGKFHSYMATITPHKSGSGVVISKLVDNNWIGTATLSGGAYAGSGGRIDFRPTSGTCAIDDFKIYFPQDAKIICDIADKQDVALDTVVELVSNTRINASTANKATITANGEAVGYTISSDKYKNSYIYNIEGGLQPDTTYVITTGESGVRDFYDQYYNTTVTFKTAAVEEPTTPPTEEPTTPPTEEPTTPPTEEPTTPPTEEPEVTLTATTTVNISGSNAVYTVKAETNNAEGATVKCYIAQYKEDGTLAGVTIKDVVIPSGSTSKNDGGMVTVLTDVKTIKVLSWDTKFNAVGAASVATR